MFANRKAGKILKIFCLMLSLFVAVCAAGLPEKVQAEETKEKAAENPVDSHRDSIVRVESICWDGDSTVYQKKSFSGFVAANDTSGIYIVTIQDGLKFSTEEKEVIEEKEKKRLKAEEEAKLSDSEKENQTTTEPTVRIAEKIEVILNGDVRVKASVVGESEQRNLTVLKLEQTINFENTFEFPQKEEENQDTGTEISLLGYPQQEGTAVYNSESVQVTEGAIAETYEQDEVSFFYHDIQADEGCIGGPLLYKDGLLAGVYLTSAGEKKGTAISSESLKAFLETFKIAGKEHQEEKKEQAKPPVLNILLGIVILILLIQVITRGNGRNNIQKKTGDTNTRQKKKGKKQNTSGNTRSVAKNISNIKASLEYPSEKRVILINKPEFLIGRTREMDFILPENKGISRKHACIRFDGQDFYLSDLDSTNHTFLNGNQLMPGKQYKLKTGDEVRVGKEKMMFYRS